LVRRGAISALVALLVCGLFALPALAYVSQGARTVVVPSSPRGPVFGSATVRCSTGQHVLFGGFENGVAGMRRTTVDRWTVDGFNLGGPVLRLTSHAYCGYGPVATKSTKTVRIRTNATATAQCPAGKVVVAGGFATARNTVFAVTRLQRIGAGRLTVSGYLRYQRTARSTLTAIAFCGPGPAPTAVTTKLTTTNAGGRPRASCPAGKTLTFGGVIATKKRGAPPPLVFIMRAVNQGIWEVADSSAGTVTSIAYCR
jgi:hypothetical protein